MEVKSSKESFPNSYWLYANFFLLSEKLSDIKCYKWKLEILLGKKKETLLNNYLGSVISQRGWRNNPRRKLLIKNKILGLPWWCSG